MPTADPHRSIPALTCCSVSSDAEGDSVTSREEAAGGGVRGSDLEKAGPSGPLASQPQQGRLALFHGKHPPGSAQDPCSSGCSGPPQSQPCSCGMARMPSAMSGIYRLEGKGMSFLGPGLLGQAGGLGLIAHPATFNPCGEAPGQHEGAGDPVTVCGGVLRSPSLSHITEPSPWSWLGSPSLPSAPCTALRPLLSQVK